MLNSWHGIFWHCANLICKHKLSINGVGKAWPPPTHTHTHPPPPPPPPPLIYWCIHASFWLPALGHQHTVPLQTCILKSERICPTATETISHKGKIIRAKHFLHIPLKSMWGNAHYVHVPQELCQANLCFFLNCTVFQYIFPMGHKER